MQKLTEWILAALCLVGIFAVVLANPDPFARQWVCQATGLCPRSTHATFWNNLLYEFGLGAVVSVFFYWLLVKIPEGQKRRRLRNYLSQSYDAFREDAALQLLFASGIGSVDFDLVEQIKPQAEFRAYFKKPSELVKGDRWHDVLNNARPEHIRSLMTISSMLRDDIVFVLNNTDVADKQTFEFLQRMSKSLYASQTESEHDDSGQDRFLGLMWSLMSGWSVVTGYPEQDPIVHIIERI